MLTYRGEACKSALILVQNIKMVLVANSEKIKKQTSRKKVSTNS